MAYKREVYIEAKNRLDKRRLSAETKREQRRSEVLLEFPELQQIEDEMASHGAAAVKAVGMGGDVAAYIKELSVKNLIAQDKLKALLKKGGYSEDYLDVKYTCEKCKDTGSHDGYYCECYKKLISETAIEMLGTNPDGSRCSFENFRTDLYPDVQDPETGVNQREYMTKVFNFCKQYAEGFSLSSPNLLLAGKTGLGKTHLSLAIASTAIRKGYNVHYDSIQNLMNKLEREHFGRSTSEDSVRDEILECELLIIDDMGVEFITQYTLAEIHNIINTRILNGLPTIISTNLEMKDIEQTYSQRIASRIIGNYRFLRFCGKDIRQIKK